ncbi:MAG: VPGUxxT family thioredoxin-like (seleno)protein, type 2, partial [Bacteroidota bacterium]
QVSWYRNYGEALSEAAKTKKPVLILFQEVPGCATCRNYGHNVLSHPLMVDAISHEFVPLAIFNNNGGEDKKILQKYNEPTWNNPVVRIVDAGGKDLVNRVSGNYSALGLLEAMEKALFEAGKPIPGYLQVMREELTAAARGNVQEAYFQMYCFWSGEGHLGKADGIVATEPGFMSGHEVVKVRYDANVTSSDKLSNHAQKAGCKPISAHKSYRPDKDPQYYLKHSAYKYLPLTDLQKSRVNSALGKGGNPAFFLSPTQKRWLAAAQKRNSGTALYTKGFLAAWRECKL